MNRTATENHHARVYCDGVFDLGPHAGHIGFFQEIRRVAERECQRPIILIVGVISDADAMSYKRRPVVEERLRAMTTKACRHVDVVIPNSPLILTDKFIDENRISLVFHGNDSDQEEFFAVPIRRGIMRYCQYDPEATGITTTKLIQRCKGY